MKWEDKVEDVRSKMTEENADVLVVSALDETACTCNIHQLSFLSYSQNMPSVFITVIPMI